MPSLWLHLASWLPRGMLLDRAGFVQPVCYMRNQEMIRGERPNDPEKRARDEPNPIDEWEMEV